jgi:hypothetical protein
VNLWRPSRYFTKALVSGVEIDHPSVSIARQNADVHSLVAASLLVVIIKRSARIAQTLLCLRQLEPTIGEGLTLATQIIGDTELLALLALRPAVADGPFAILVGAVVERARDFAKSFVEVMVAPA